MIKILDLWQVKLMWQVLDFLSAAFYHLNSAAKQMS